MDMNEEVGGHEEIMENYYNDGFEGKSDDVVLSIEQMLKELPPINKKCFMYQVPKMHLMMNDTVYTPQRISIGPFHHGQPQYKAAEQYKLYALKRYLYRIKLSVGEAMNIAERWEERARSCYAVPTDHMNKDEFVKMMLLDACFILEFMNTIMCKKEYWGENESSWMDFTLLDGQYIDLERDLVMYENQLPLFVLRELFKLSLILQNIDDDDEVDINSLDVIFMKSMAELFYATTSGYRLPYNVIESKVIVRHLVDLLRCYYIPSYDTEEYNKFKETKNKKYATTPTITELYEAGVKVQKAKKAKSLMDFSFKNGVLKIPPFIIHTNFELHIRNLITSETFAKMNDDNDNIRYIFHYIALLDDLINTEKDISILLKEDIIENFTGGSNQEVAKLFNNLRLYARTFPTKYYFTNMSKDLNNYCNKWWHRSMASLRRDYFNTPWASISFIAATILLIFTFLQTLFSIPSIFHV